MSDIRDIYSEKIDLTALMKLEELLTKAGIPHECYEEPEMGGGTIKIPSHADWSAEKGPRASIIQHRGSSGGKSGLLEVWARPGMKNPQGWLTAAEAMDIIESFYVKKVKKC